jgi:2-polyprenyl-6-methoxyphenol hydroxylase-like FAD-dependent oxidoreductase
MPKSGTNSQEERMATTARAHPEPAEVLIAGAGPAGLAAAIELGMRGIDCLVIDPRVEVSHRRPRGKTTHARTMEHLRRWGLASELRAQSPTPPETFHDVAFCTSLRSREIHRLPNALGMFETRQPEMAETGLFIGQPRVEETLRRKVDDLPTVRTWYGAWVTGDVAVDQDGAEVAVSDEHGAALRIRARYVIVADGPRSVLRERIGIPLIASDEGRPSVSILFRAPGLFERVAHRPAVFYWCIGDRAGGVLSPYDPSAGLWVAGSRDLRAETDPATVIGELVGEPVGIDVVSVDVWQARRAVAERYREGPFLLVGDSARQTPPFGGHGYNTCVLDAVDVSWKLAAVLRGWAAEGLLDTYELERRTVANYVIETSTQNMRVLSDDLVRPDIDEPGPRGDDIRAAVAEEIDVAKRSEFYSLGLVLGYHYAHSPAVYGNGARDQPTDGTVYLPSFAPGSRLPHSWLPDGRSLFDLLGLGFSLLARDPRPAAPIVDAARARGIPLTTIGAAEIPAAYDCPAFILVRPDQHITWSGERVDVHADELWDVATGVRPAPSRW